MKKLIALLLTLVMVLGLCACDNGPETPEEVLAAATEKMADMKSAAFSMEISMGLKSGGREFPLSVRGEGEMMTDPQTVHMTMTLDMLILKMTMELYTQAIENTVTAYIGLDAGEGMEWFRQAVEVPQNPVVNSVEAMKLIRNLAEAAESVEMDGIAATRSDGEITGEDIRKAVEGVLGSMDQVMGEEASAAMDEIFGALDDSVVLPVTYYIDRENLTVMELTMDMTSLLESLMNLPELQEAGAAFSQMVITIRYSELDSVEEIVIPQEALEAPEIPAA